MLVSAQDSYEQGSYWGVASVDTKSGQFDAYMDDLSSLWKKQMEMMQKAASAGAMMDTSMEEWETMTKKLTGSMDKSRDLSMKRGEIRSIMSDILLRELNFR
jgi:hypothetical protein